MAKKFNPEISVIIPTYNTANFIEECLQSVMNQTFKNFEVLVVDDCSKDNSVEVVQKISADFGGRLILIKMNKNSGCPCIPRNFALNSARGKYIYFLDSDDFIDETTLEDFYKVAEDFQADVVHAEKCFVYENFRDEVGSFQTGEFVEVPTLETFDLAKRVNGFIKKRFLWWACNKLFRRKFLEENKLQFPNMTSFEDLVFAFFCITSAKNYVRVPFVNYHYRIREKSLSHKSTDAIESTKNLKEAITALDNFMRGRKFFVDNPQFRYAVIDFFAQERLEKIAENLFIASKLNPGEVYDFFEREIFFGENSALASYFFVTAGIYKLLLRQGESFN